MDAIYILNSLLFPTWIALSLSYGIFLMIRSGKRVKWLGFSIFSLIESILTVLVWGILGVVGVAIFIFPIWLYMAHQVLKFNKGGDRNET